MIYKICLIEIENYACSRTSNKVVVDTDFPIDVQYHRRWASLYGLRLNLIALGFGLAQKERSGSTNCKRFLCAILNSREWKGTKFFGKVKWNLRGNFSFSLNFSFFICLTFHSIYHFLSLLIFFKYFNLIIFIWKIFLSNYFIHYKICKLLFSFTYWQ